MDDVPPPPGVRRAHPMMRITDDGDRPRVRRRDRQCAPPGDAPPRKNVHPNFKVTPRAKALAIEYARTHVWNRGMIARKMGIRPRTLAAHLAADPDWRDLMDQARLEFVSRIDDELYRRGVTGVDDFRFGPDGEKHSIKQYSDALLVRIAKKCDPEGHGDRVRVDQRTLVRAEVGFDSLPLEAQTELLAIFQRIEALNAPAVPVDAPDAPPSGPEPGEVPDGEPGDGEPGDG